ncbi:MAG: hypothetical protein EBS00_07985 [Verrucomicrobia bacterium]|nr:hypothetical protein [Verrucomicrobiota bacterium]
MKSLILALILATTEGAPPAGSAPAATSESAANPSSNPSAPTNKQTENLNQAMDNLGEALKKGEKKIEGNSKRSAKSKSASDSEKELSKKSSKETKETAKPLVAEEIKPDAESPPAAAENLEATIDSATQIANEAARLALEEAAKLNAIGSSEINMPLQSGKEMVHEAVKIAKETLPLKEEKPPNNQPAGEPARP